MLESDDCISVRKVALDCLSYHATASDPDTDALTKAPVPSSQVFNLDRWVSDEPYSPYRKLAENNPLNLIILKGFTLICYFASPATSSTTCSFPTMRPSRS